MIYELDLDEFLWSVRLYSVCFSWGSRSKSFFFCYFLQTSWLFQQSVTIAVFLVSSPLRKLSSAAFEILVVRAPGTTTKVAGQPKIMIQLSEGQPQICSQNSPNSRIYLYQNLVPSMDNHKVGLTTRNCNHLFVLNSNAGLQYFTRYDKNNIKITASRIAIGLYNIFGDVCLRPCFTKT